MDAEVTDHDRSVIYASLLVTLFLAALDQTIVSTALPSMVEDLEAVDRYAWVATAYLLASTALALVYGKLADTYSRKRITLWAVVLFLVGSVLCGLAGEFGRLPLLGDGMTQLILFRGIQGIGGGGIFAMTFIIIADLFTPVERGRYQAYVGRCSDWLPCSVPWSGGSHRPCGGHHPRGRRMALGVLRERAVRWRGALAHPAAHALVRTARGEGSPGLRRRAATDGRPGPLILAIQLDKRVYPWMPGSGMVTGGSGSHPCASCSACSGSEHSWLGRACRPAPSWT
jgi:MFS family permease